MKELENSCSIQIKNYNYDLYNYYGLLILLLVVIKLSPEKEIIKSYAG